MIAVISDIHGNIAAAEAVLRDIDAQKASEVISLGDVVGYGPNPVECTDLVRSRVRTNICGNHDVAVLSQAFGFNRYAKDAIDWTRRVMRPRWYSLPATVARWRFLENLPDRHRRGDVYFVHASPRDPITEYVEESDTVDMGFGPSEKIIQIMSMVERLCFIGHSHKHGIVTGEHKWLSMKDLPANTFRLEPGAKALVNVGSVGQPRDGDWRACYVLWDGDTIVFRRVEYDIQSTIARIRAIPQLHEKLAQRLLSGK